MIASGVAKRYAKALFELASEQKTVETIGKGLADVAGALESSVELRGVLENPKYLPETKKQVVRGVAERAGAPTMLVNALMMLTERGRLVHLRAISDAYQSMAEAQAGRLRAEVISATQLPEAYYAELERTLSEATGRKVQLVRRTDPSLIGGVVAKVGDVVFDGSIKNRLRDIRHQLLVAASPQGRA
ncbi:ATP synthase F1 subunit delta [Sandaracinus amylolyticus]|uniref:ATP synthase subunit delta n=1 Tax=Sandaracinus amylolyticus TaxID=927083 RepID=A0A0F6YI31_9BACT|nr:ATP synthase F1 subunit delta [Sandaracinus amylolyticus]AKF05463.1 ATP synthase delta chain [Sandaracinus amylolyticus]